MRAPQYQLKIEIREILLFIIPKKRKKNIMSRGGL